jgi:hypothetical protein
MKKLMSPLSVGGAPSFPGSAPPLAGTHTQRLRPFSMDSRVRGNDVPILDLTVT